MKNFYIITITFILFNSILSGQSLVVGFTLGEVVNISNTTVSYDTLYIMKDGVLNIDSSNVTVNYLLAVDSIAQFSVNNSNLTLNGRSIFYRSSTSIIKDTLNIKGDIIIGGDASLLIDSAIVSANMSYVGQYEFLVFDSASFEVSNSSFQLGNGKFGGGFMGSATFNQTNTQYHNSIGIAMTLGMVGEASFTSNNCSGGVELVINDSCNVDITNSSWSLLWHSFDNGSIANFNFPAQNSLMPKASDVVYSLFSDSLPGVSGINYQVRVQNSDTVFWGMFPYAGSDVTLNNSSVIACGFTFNGSTQDTLSNFVNDSMYSSYTAPLSDRDLVLNNSEVGAWNFYPQDTSTLVIKDCLFGEVLTFNQGLAIVENSTCDGTGGYVGAYNNSKVHIKQSVIKRSYAGAPAIILNEDNSLIILEESTVSAQVVVNDTSTLVYSNTVYDSIPQVNNSAYFLEAYIDIIPLAFTDSVVDITGILKGVNGPTNFDNISRYKLEYSLPDSTNFILIHDTAYTPYIVNALIKTWNTTGVAPGNYLLWLTTYVNGYSIIASKRDIVLNNINRINKIQTQQLSIYPNPTTGLITINNEETQVRQSQLRMMNVAVYDIYGKEVLKQEVRIQKYEVDLSQQTKGIYIIKVTTNKGVAIEKIILE